MYLAALGALAAWFLYLKRPEIPGMLLTRFSALHSLLMNKYYFDWFNENVLARATRALGDGLWKVGDQTVIDGAAVNGSARVVGVLAVLTRELQSGYLYHYAFAMLIGVAGLITWFMFGFGGQ
jgi:NADH-quinone oxidoreductase subunit L